MGQRADGVVASPARAMRRICPTARRWLRRGVVVVIFGALLTLVALVQHDARAQRRRLERAHARFGLPPPHLLEQLVPNAHHLWNVGHIALSPYIKPSGRVNTPERLARAKAGARAAGRKALSMADVYRFGLEVDFHPNALGRDLSLIHI